MASAEQPAFGAGMKMYQFKRAPIKIKSVAIIGAGPSGLVAARTLQRSQSIRFDIRIFEKTAEIGGLWSVNKDRPYDGMLNPNMPTNLSRFNLGFVEFPWTKAKLSGHVHYWPKAWQVNQYLEKYVENCFPEETFRFNTKVIYAGLERGQDQNEKWRVRWRSALADGVSEEQEETFDYLVVASGFFGASSMPSFPQAETAGVKVVHSTKLRTLQDVIPENHTGSGTILVVGGGMSGGDASTVIATELSDATHSPSGSDKYNKVKLVQLCTDRAYALPLAAPNDQTHPKAPEFLPLDLCMYKLDTRPEGNITMSAGKVTDEYISMIHGAFQGAIGDDQTNLKVQDLIYNDKSTAPYVTLTELYAGFIRSRNIQITSGRLEDVFATEDKVKGKVRVTYSNKGSQNTIDDVIGIVYATGFTPQPSLDFLSPEVLELLEHDPKHNRLPVILDEYATLTDKIPSLAFIGFHEGAFWGSMEMESRLVRKRWTSPSVSSQAPDHESIRATLRDLRVSMTNKSGDVPQYWMGDYVGLMEEIGREVDIKRQEFTNQLNWPPRSGPVSVYRYTETIALSVPDATDLNEFVTVMEKSQNNAMFVSRAAFLGTQGHWHIERTITSALDSMPSGILSGEASFHPRHPTSPEFDYEFLYVEHGTFRINNGLTMQATRQYVYRYSEAEDKITVWFVKQDGKTVDYMYHGLSFDVKNRSQGWRAKAEHLCVADMYRSDYLFEFAGANLSMFSVVHEVKGPKKDYILETIYSR